MDSIIAIFAWLNSVLLKMTWLSDGVAWLVENILGLSIATQVGGSVHFFIYDVIKIFLCTRQISQNSYPIRHLPS